MSHRTTTPLTRLGAKLATRAGIRLLAGLVLLAVVVLMQDGVFTNSTQVFHLSHFSDSDPYGAGGNPTEVSYEQCVAVFDSTDPEVFEIFAPFRKVDRTATALRLVMWAVALVSLVPLVVPGRTRIWAWCVISAAVSLLAAGAWFWHAVSASLDRKVWSMLGDQFPAGTLTPPVTTVTAAVLCLLAAAGAVAVLRYFRLAARRDAELGAF